MSHWDRINQLAALGQAVINAERSLKAEKPGTALLLMPDSVDFRSDVVVALKQAAGHWETYTYPFDGTGERVRHKDLASACVAAGRVTVLIPQSAEQRIDPAEFKEVVDKAFAAFPGVKA